MLKVILVSGKAESGKDLSAEYIKNRLEKLGYKVVIDRFAKYIKGYVKQIKPNWDGQKDDTIRELLQKLGTDIIKEKLNYRTFHSSRMCVDALILQELGVDYLIIPDTRFSDEIYNLKAVFGDNVKTLRINRENHKSKLTEDQLKHKSETSLDNFNFDDYINNNGDVNALYRQLDLYTEELVMEG